MSIHPQIIEKDGKKEFVVLPYDEFLVIREALEDFDDLKELRAAKAKSHGSSTVSLDSIRSELLED